MIKRIPKAMIFSGKAFLPVVGAGILFFSLGAGNVSSAEPKPGMVINRLIYEAKDLASKGKLLEAKEKYKDAISRLGDRKLKGKIENELGRLNIRILFSRIPAPDSVLYEVKAGDSLYKIAQENNTTVELLMKSNALKGELIYPGMKLKVVKGEFSILVDRSANRLYLKEGDEVIKKYRVATGENLSTPLGTFTIENKLSDPTWYHENKVIPPGDPENILGTRWLGFSIPTFGIHGTTLPESIGTFSSSGCVRMLNEDVEELYSIVPVKTKVTVVK